MADLRRLRRVRWGVRGALALGVFASLAANVLHAEPNIVGRTIAAWPPVALLVVVELISRVPVHRWYLATARLVSTVAVASIAAWVSYWHMADVAARYGESVTSAHMIPISVDGLVLVASVCLVEVGGRIRALEESAPAPVSVPITESNESALVAPSAPVVLDVAPVDESPVVEPTEPEPAPEDEPVVEPLETPKPAVSAPKQSPVRRGTKPTPAPKLTKKAQLLALWSAVSPDDRRSEAQIVGEIAAQIDLAPSTARRYVASAKKAAPMPAPVADITADEPVVVAVAA
ncbi:MULTISPECIES: DUF2637 domain-containing protein [Parafrankia]|uniref:DUF2637 domain-containing protein n=1 Tax=Parafrankia TaxID=2994362 RepID=UPI001A9589B9|nr:MULTISPECIES: DUF2637 domain-containing protein [Parafrankia]